MENFKSKPILTDKAEKTFRKKYFLNCLRGCKWSPDGSCIVTNSDDHRLRLFNLPDKFIQSDQNVELQQQQQQQQTDAELEPVLEIKESQIIYDYCWYPYMNSFDYSTCFLLCCSRDVPIHLWDAYTGQLFQSFIALNYVHELATSRSICFMNGGRKFLSSYEKFLCIFDLSRPGNHGDYIYNIPKGIISCMSCNDQIFATGSFNRLISLYDIDSNECIATLKGHRGGLTYLLLSQKNNHYLYSGGRKDNEILCWDLRNYGRILQIINRNCPTNQRIYFDIDNEEEFLVTGDNQHVRLYDIRQQQLQQKQESIDKDDNDKILKCFNEFKASDNRVNGVSIHPTLPLLATTSGERCLLDFSNDEDNENNSSNDNIIFDYNKTYSNDINMKFWWFNNGVVDCLATPTTTTNDNNNSNNDNKDKN